MTTGGDPTFDAVWSSVVLPQVHANLDNGVSTKFSTMKEEDSHSISNITHETSRVITQTSEKVVKISQHSEHVVEESFNSSSSYHLVSGSAESASLENGNVSHAELNGFSTLGNNNIFNVENGVTDNELEIKNVVLGAGASHLETSSHVIENLPQKNLQQDSVIAELKKVQYHDQVEHLSEDNETLKGSDDEGEHEHHDHHQYDEIPEPYDELPYTAPPPEPPRDYESDSISILTGTGPHVNGTTGFGATPVNHAYDAVPSHHSSRHSLHERAPSHHSSLASVHSHHSHHTQQLHRTNDLSLISLANSQLDLHQRPDSRTSTTSEARGVREVPIVIKDIQNGDADAFFTSKLTYNKDVHTIREYGTTGRADSRRSSTSTLRDFDDHEPESAPQVVRNTAQYINGASNHVANTTSNNFKTTTTTYSYNYTNDTSGQAPSAPLRANIAAAAAATAAAANARNRTYTNQSEYEVRPRGYTGHSEVKSRAHTAQSEIKPRALTGQSEIKQRAYTGQTDVTREASSVASSRRESFSSCINCPVCRGVSPTGQVITKKSKADRIKADIAKTAVAEAGKYDSLRVVKNVTEYKTFLDIYNQQELDLSHEDDPIQPVQVLKPRYSISGRSSSLKASNPRTNKFLNHRPVLLPPHTVFENNLTTEKRGYASQQLYENHHQNNNGKLDRATSYHTLPEIDNGHQRRGTILTIHEEEEYTPINGRSRQTSQTSTNHHEERYVDKGEMVHKLRKIFEDTEINSRRTSVASVLPPVSRASKPAQKQHQIRCICRHSYR